MNILLIGGTGTISAAVLRRATALGYNVSILNRGLRRPTVPIPAATEILHGDINDEAATRALLGDRRWDVVCQFIAYTPDQVERDIRLFGGRCDQYVFISSASAYRKPLLDPVITESTPLGNPYWQYSRDKQACEESLQRAHRDRSFPITIVRPSHTYSERSIPTPLHGRIGSWQVMARMLAGKPVIVHGDGQSLWTFTWADDFAVGFVGLLGNPRAIGEAYHITSDERISWNQALLAIGAALGVAPVLCHVSSDMLIRLRPDLEGPLLGDKAVSVLFDNSKIKRAVPAFRADMRFDQGVRRCWSYIAAHPELQPADPEFDAWCDLVVAAVERFGAD
ncbi:MAG: SDR family oxidoreductase [Bacillota bacterium]|nr:SDR family oxidoreductase [Bacillota bacterium]